MSEEDKAALVSKEDKAALVSKEDSAVLVRTVRRCRLRGVADVVGKVVMYVEGCGLVE